jgi:hypothetical protein
LKRRSPGSYRRDRVEVQGVLSFGSEIRFWLVSGVARDIVTQINAFYRLSSQRMAA